MSTDRFKSFRNTVQLKLGNFFGKPSQPEKSGVVNNLQAAIFTEQRAAKLAAENDPRRVQIMQSLVEKLWTRYQRLGNFADLETALQNCQQLLEEIPSSHPEKPRILIKSAVCFRDRYIRNGDPRDIEAAIENGQAALNLAKEDQDKVHATICLARCFKARYQRLKESGDINTAMQKYQAVLENLTTSNLQTEKPQVLFELATCFADRFDRSRELSDLQEAIEQATAALHLTPVEAMNRVQIQRGLAWAFQKLSERLGTVDDLNTAIQKYQEILGQILTDHPERGRLLFDLATSLGDRFKILGELDDLYAAVNNAEKALSVIPMGHPYQVNVKRGLAWCYQESFRRTGNLEHLRIAIDGYKEILEQIPINNNAERAMIRWNLATSLADRYRRLTDLMDLEAVAINCQAALRLIPSEDSRSMQILHRLAWYSHTRYQRLGDIKDLETSIQRYEEVLDRILPDYQRATTLFNLAAAFRDRYERSGDLENLNSAMDKSQMALDLMPSDRRLDRADMLKGSASYHHTKYEKLGNLQDLEIAIQRYQQSLDLSPKDTQADGLEGLAICFRDRYRKAGDPSDLADAMQKFQEAIKFLPENHPYKAPGQQGLASCFCEQYKRLGKSKDLKSARDLYTSSFRASTLTNPQKSWNAALEWAVFADEHKPEYSLSAYLAAFQLLPNILWIGNTISTRHDIMQHLNIGAVTANAAKAFVQLSKAGTGVEIIEQGVATVFQQMLQLRPEIDTLSGQLAQEFQRLSMELFDGTSDDLQRIAVQRNALLDEIRAKRGHQYFLLPKPYDALCQVARGGPVIILNSHQISCDAMIILDTTSRLPVSVTFPGVTADLLKAKQNSLRELVGRCNVRYRGQSATETRLQGGREGTLFRTVHEQFADLLQWLWRHVVDPVYKVLAFHGVHKGRLWWLPTGAFGGLPLHASSKTDHFIHSYTMTLGSLIDARAKKSPNKTKPQVGVVGVSYTGPNKQNYLNGVAQEVEKINTIFRGRPLDSLQMEHATPDAVKEQIKNCSWVHLACHGVQDSVEPTKSRLLLYEGNLELETILRMPLSHAEFVFLSACQTAMGDAELVNESFHLGGGFIAAGFQSVVGTLWSMNDQDGPLVAELFYSHLFKQGRQPRASDTAEALHIAVKELRYRNVPYERWIPFIHMGV